MRIIDPNIFVHCDYPGKTHSEMKNKRVVWRMKQHDGSWLNNSEHMSRDDIIASSHQELGLAIALGYGYMGFYEHKLCYGHIAWAYAPSDKFYDNTDNTHGFKLFLNNTIETVIEEAKNSRILYIKSRNSDS